MDEKEEGMLLGELKEFKRVAMERLDEIEKKVSALDKFKIKVTIVMASVMGGIELCFRLYEALK